MLLPQTLGLAAPHLKVPVQVPQDPIVPPHPSPAKPQSYPRLAQVAGTQMDAEASGELMRVFPPHLSKPAPPQNSPGAQVGEPQLTVLPHPSAATPQSYPRSVHFFGVHTGPPSGKSVGSAHWL
jgi:hypothetical protein